MDLIEESQILKHILNLKDKNDSNIYEDKLKKLLENYELEENIKIYYDYNECKKLKNLNEEENNKNKNKYKYKENEFIIVDNDFKIIFIINIYM